jgi:uncharacterized protein YqcC (DUF446 family)
LSLLGVSSRLQLSEGSVHSNESKQRFIGQAPSDMMLRNLLRRHQQYNNQNPQPKVLFILSPKPFALDRSLVSLDPSLEWVEDSS